MNPTASPGRRRRQLLGGLSLGLAGLGLTLFPLPLLEASAPPAHLAGVPVLLGFVTLGPLPGGIAWLLSQAPHLWPPAVVAPAPFLALVEALAVSVLYRRFGFLTLSAAMYWASAGWVLALSGVPESGDATAAVLGQALGGWLNAMLGDAVLLAGALRAGTSAKGEGLEAYLAGRGTLAVAGPAWLLALLGGRAVVAHEGAAGTAPALAAIGAVALGLVLAAWAVLSRLARSVVRPLAAAGGELADPQRPPGDIEPLALEEHPVAELRELGARLAVVYRTLAYHDALTGLPNRKLLLDRLGLAAAQALRVKEGVVLLYVDLDRFRAVDHSLGRDRGDAVLLQVVDRLRECARDGDTVARVGDDEFALILPRVADMEEAMLAAQRVMDSIRRAIIVDGSEVFVTASVGISLCPRDGQDAETLLKNAQAATHVAKEGGQDTYRRYTARFSAKDARRLVIESALRGALSRGEMVLHYQPKVDLSTGAVAGAEALVRCPNAGGALLPPAEFIPIAESSDLIIELGRAVLTGACRTAAAWRRKGHRLAVAVNLSARQLQHPELVSQVLGVLGEAGLEARALELEVTESVALADLEHSIETLRELKRHGVAISMDDFGTGYSSLGYLRRLPVDTVKLDKSFVGGVRAGSNDAAIAVAVIALAHSLNLKVVAEGVETGEQLALLRRHGCDAIQGFLFSAPLPPEDFERLLNEDRRLAFDTGAAGSSAGPA